MYQDNSNDIINTVNIFNYTNSVHHNIKEETTEAHISGEILMLLGLLGLTFLLAHFFKKIKFTILNESLCATILGLIAGLCLFFAENKKYIENINLFYTEFFLILLLPVIVFESAYNLKRHDFIKNLGSIFIYAILGTLISIFVIAGSSIILSYFNLFTIKFTLGESLAFGALISSTDPVSVLATFKDFPVEPNFFQLIFGESIMNDAVSIVFYESSVKYKDEHLYSSFAINILFTFGRFALVFIGSLVMGFVSGYLAALLLKFASTKNPEYLQRIEIGIVMIVPWVFYLIASMCSLSGIVVVLFNGLALAGYAKPGLSDFSKIVSKLIIDYQDNQNSI